MDNTALQVGVAEMDVTPEEPIRMAGYGGRVEPSEGVYDRLRSKALVFENADGERSLLITNDLIGFDKAFSAEIGEAVRERTGIPRERLIVNASHTHCGPLFGRRYGTYTKELTPEQTTACEAYSERLIGLLADVAAAAVEDLAPAKLSWGMGLANIMINRRQFKPEGIRIGFNPRGYVDRGVPILRVEGDHGALRAVLFGVSCHNTTTSFRFISADHAGFAQRYIERDHPGCVALFMQGVGADANPYPRREYELSQRHGESVGAEVCRVLAEEEFAPVRGPLRVAFDDVVMPLEGKPTPESLAAMRQGEAWEGKMADRLEAMIADGHEWIETYAAPLEVWRFDADLTLVALSAEAVSDWLPLCERALGHRKLWVSGYNNDYHGYLPSARVHREGGYEGHDFISGIGFLARETEQVVLAKVRELAAGLGRALPED